jgi:hypothetical protein
MRATVCCRSGRLERFAIVHREGAWVIFDGEPMRRAGGLLLLADLFLKLTSSYNKPHSETRTRDYRHATNQWDGPGKPIHRNSTTRGQDHDEATVTDDACRRGAGCR